MRLLLLLVLLPLLIAGCVPTTCTATAEASIELGQGIAEAFEAYVDGQTVTIEPASQGGFGFPILVQSVGLQAGENQDATVTMDTVVEGVSTGTWTQNTQLTCPDERGGRTPSVLHVGFDPDVYETTDDFIDLQGETIELDVTMTDQEGNSASVIQRVTLALGG
jgi:hypothetical protein